MLNNVEDFAVFTLIYDITSKKSFKKVVQLVNKMKQNTYFLGGQRVIILGNKKDKQNERKVSVE